MILNCVILLLKVIIYNYHFKDNYKLEEDDKRDLIKRYDRT